jgi:Haem-binding domain
MPRWLKRAVLPIIAVLVAIQFIPVDRTNPAVDPAKAIFAAGIVPDDVSAILRRSCQDCHSDQTHWPWYSHVAPVSWLVASDVHGAREQLNLSEWSSYSNSRKDDKLEEICKQLQEGEMPDGKYTLIHASARMSQAERALVCKWTEQARKGLSLQAPSTGPR